MAPLTRLSMPTSSATPRHHMSTAQRITASTGSASPMDFHRAVSKWSGRILTAGLLFAGTISAGLYVFSDNGVHWQPLRANLPSGVSVMDLTSAPGAHSLVLATHGRGVWVLDDLRPVEEYDAQTAREPFHVFSASPGMLLNTTPTNRASPSIRDGGQSLGREAECADRGAHQRGSHAYRAATRAI